MANSQMTHLACGPSGWVSMGMPSLSVLNSQMVPLGGSLSLLMESLKYMTPFLSFQSKPLGSCTPCGPNSCRHTNKCPFCMHLLLCWCVCPPSIGSIRSALVQRLVMAFSPRAEQRGLTHMRCLCAGTCTHQSRYMHATQHHATVDLSMTVCYVTLVLQVQGWMAHCNKRYTR